ncbi:MAG: hypothetical protein IMF19_12865 [Proteobacteria bacterium]|nr:hypothetical protein [Pseudomonadota bacterium]
MYCLLEWDDRVPTDYDKVERIYLMGLDNATSDRDVILERLQHLEEKRKADVILKEITAILLSGNGEEDKRLSIFAKVHNLENVLGID